MMYRPKSSKATLVYLGNQSLTISSFVFIFLLLLNPKIKLIKLDNEKSRIKNIKTKNSDGKQYLFDPVRGKYILSTPEEWVRQNILFSLIHEYGFPKSLIAVEKQLIVNAMTRRTDIVVHDNSGNPLILVECKAPQVKISEATFNQIAAYNYALKVPYLIISNLEQTFIIQIDFIKKEHGFLKTIPNYKELVRKSD